MFGRMKKLICALYFVCLPTLSMASTSYPDLATSSIQKAWDQFHNDAAVLDQSGFQPHDTKELRKRIGALREVMDLFVYSYWNTKKQDPWMQIRDFLDEGYELIGSYKDLYDIQNVSSADQAVYDNDEVQPLRREIQNWWMRWNLSSKNVYVYLTTPSQDSIFERKKSDLSRFYWGASNLVPQLDLSGEENLSLLSQDLLQTTRQDWPTVKKIKNPYSSLEKENQFHDFRKRLRSVARILRAYGSFYNGSEENLARLEDLSTRYGTINDKIATAHRAEKRGKNKKVEKLNDQIKEEWQELVQFQKDQDIEDLLQQILQSIQ